MLIPAARDLFQGSKLFLAPFIIFFFLGLVLLVLTIKSNAEQPLKKYLLLAGFSAVGIFIFVVLHNMFYALGVVAEDIKTLKILAEALHVVFFFLALIVAPVGFLTGIIGGIKYIIRP